MKSSQEDPFFHILPGVRPMNHHGISLALAALILISLAVPACGAAACTAPAECLTAAQAAEWFGAGNYVQASRDACGYLTDATGARAPQYCYQQAASAFAPFVPVTTTGTVAPPVRRLPVTTPATTVPAGVPAVPTTQYAIASTTSPTTPTTQPYAPAYTTPVNAVPAGQPTTSPASTSTPFMPINQPGNTVATPPGNPLVISAGSHLHAPLLGAGSPYAGLHAANLTDVPFIYIETDWIDNGQRDYFSGEHPVVPNWSDFTTLTIGKTEKTHMGNFRYMTGLTDVKSVLFQVSRYPFPNDPAHWQNQYIPGLVASGEAQVYHTDSEGYRYFRIDFARVAKQNPGDPPYYVGTAPYDPGQLGQGVVLPAADIPFTSSSLVLKTFSAGPVSLPLPVSLISVSPGELTQSQLGNPNENMTLTCTDCPQLRNPTVFENLMLDADQTYYVRVVPIRGGGKAGVPAIPVAVTVRRPHPCPTVTSDVMVSLPSAEIVWYMRPNFPGPGGGTHWYYPWDPPEGDPFVPKGYHELQPPPTDEDKPWWEELIDTFTDVINFFSWVVTQYSQLWNFMEDTVVSLVGNMLTIGWCSDHPECTTCLKIGLQAVMAAYGIPPTLPTGPELMDASTDYMVRLGADQLGAGDLYDAYQDLPQEGKEALNDLKNQAQENAARLAQESENQRYDESVKYRCFFDPQYTCTHKIPDPIFSSAHEASVVVYVSNPAQNAGPTDRVFMTVADSRRLFIPGTRIIPPLPPGEAVPVPVVLAEDYARFRKDNGGPCDPSAPVKTEGGSSSYTNLSYCLQSEWVKVFNQPGTDTFSVTFSTGQKYGTGGAELAGLDAGSGGKALSSVIVVDPGAGVCGIQHSVRFPQGWTVATPPYLIDPKAWDNFFDAGNGPNQNYGFLRNKP